MSYARAHRAVVRLRGRAAQHACVDCGSAAHDWSYDNADPHAIDDGVYPPYSVDPAHYQARCKSCHKRFDVPFSTHWSRRAS